MEIHKLMGTKRERENGMNWEIGIDIYTILCIKWITNENLLYSIENSTQCSVMTCKGRKTKKDEISEYVWMIHFAVQ